VKTVMVESSRTLLFAIYFLAITGSFFLVGTAHAQSSSIGYNVSGCSGTSRNINCYNTSYSSFYGSHYSRQAQEPEKRRWDRTLLERQGKVKAAPRVNSGTSGFVVVNP
jgi:hypothetical protein